MPDFQTAARVLSIIIIVTISIYYLVILYSENVYARAKKLGVLVVMDVVCLLVPMMTAYGAFAKKRYFLLPFIIIDVRLFTIYLKWHHFY
jgi:hypothetical protein